MANELAEAHCVRLSEPLTIWLFLPTQLVHLPLQQSLGNLSWLVIRTVYLRVETPIGVLPF